MVLFLPRKDFFVVVHHRSLREADLPHLDLEPLVGRPDVPDLDVDDREARGLVVVHADDGARPLVFLVLKWLGNG